VIIALSTDLMDRSRFPAGTTFVRSADRLVAPSDEVHVVAVDLGVPGAVEAVERVRARGSTVRIVGYGRHDDRERLAAARAAGCDRVLARSAFFADVAAALDAARDD
jgi:DNA-binding NarL/FixJ family response regulator